MYSKSTTAMHIRVRMYVCTMYTCIHMTRYSMSVCPLTGLAVLGVPTQREGGTEGEKRGSRVSLAAEAGDQMLASMADLH